MNFSGIALASILVLTCDTAQAQANCTPIGGVLMTNIGAIEKSINLGPVFGDFSGAVAAKVVRQNTDGSYVIQHYWVSSTGDTIQFKEAVLKPASIGDPNVVAVPWGNYKAEISGGTGLYERATGYIDCFGMADFKELTLVLRFRGELCTQPNAGKK